MTRRQAAVDGRRSALASAAAVLEGSRLRRKHALRIIYRDTVFEAAGYASDLHQWLTAPDCDQEGEIQATAAIWL